ncbi:Nn.00g096900.m01.CDS01 [Neocucurbitaria sp. VM-36]
MASPTLGCQIAPHYDHEQWPYNSDSTDSESEIEEQVEEAVESAGFDQHGFDMEKAETQRDVGGIVPTGRPTTLQRGRTKSSRKEVPQDPVGFWHWQMSGVRLHVLKLWFRTNLLLAIAIMVALCLFWGALFRQNDNVKSLSIWVVDFDGQAPYSHTTPFVGPFVTQSVRNIVVQGGPVPGYTFASPGDFSNDPLRVRESVYHFDAWAAIIINPNATALLEAAVMEGNASYDPLGACQIVYNSARDQTTSSSYIVPSMTVLQKHVLANFGRAWIAHLLQNNVSVTEMNMGTSPQAISPGIEFTTYDLRPFGPPIATPAVSIGLIYLIIISFFSFTFFLPIHMKYLSPKGHPPLHFSQLIIWRYIATVASYFFLSLVYSFVSLAFLMPMNRQPASHIWPAQNPNAYGRGTFVVYWMGNWVGMTAFGLASENMAMLLGTPWTAMWLIFWVISNVATGFYALELAPGFYRWGYAWPMHNIVELTRSTLFDLHPRVGLNFGILFAWCAIDTLLFPVCCYYMRWNTARVKRKAAQMDAEWQAKMEKEREAPSLLARVTTVGSRRDGCPRRQDAEGGANRTITIHGEQKISKRSLWSRARKYVGR